MKIYLTLILFISVTFSSFSIENVYQLTNVYNKSDLDYNFLNKIDSQKAPYPKNSNFMIGDIPVTKGKFRVFKFIAIKDAAYSYETTSSIMHNILLIKTDKNLVILDAFHYTLEWSDTPSDSLSFTDSKDVILSRYLQLQDLSFTNSQNEKIVIEGMIDDYYKGKLLFKDGLSKKGKNSEISMKTRDISIVDNQVEYQPGRRVQKSSYTTYIFDKNQFEKFIKKYKDFEVIDLLIEITKDKYETYITENPYEATTDQGIETHIIYANIIKVISTK